MAATARKLEGQDIPGIRLHITDRELLDDWDREAAEFTVYRRTFLLYP
jgi:hypothetical protein